MNVVEVQNLWKKFPGSIALKGVTFSLPKGVVLGLIGPNGSGKSTLLKILAGIMKPTQGTVKVFGNTKIIERKSRLAYVPELDCIYRWMTVRRFLDFCGNLFPDWNFERESKLLDFLQLEPSKKVSSLSKGMRVRLKMLQALARDSELLLLDEPLSGIDPASRGKIIDVLIDTFRMGEQTIIFSTHIVSEAERLFDRVIMLGEGNIVLEGEAEELRQKYGKSIQEIFKEWF